MAGPGQEEGRVRPPQSETRYHGKDKLEGSWEPCTPPPTHTPLHPTTLVWKLSPANGVLLHRQRSRKNLIYQLSEKQ